MSETTLPPTEPEAIPFHGDYFFAFHSAYFLVHGYLALIVCFSGITMNIFNIAVLSHKTMITPINILLTVLALADGLVLSTYIPFTLHQHIMRGVMTITTWRSYSWIAYLWFDINFTIVGHAVSVWLTVSVAVFRYITVYHPAKFHVYCSAKRAVIAILSAVVCTVLLCIPAYLSIEITELDDDDVMRLTDSNATKLYRLSESEYSLAHDHLPRIASFWTFAVLAKLLPCVLLIGLSIPLLLALRSLKTGSHPEIDGCDGTTRMIVGILVLFVITEFPSGLLALFSGISMDFHRYVYGSLGDVMDMLALVNSSVSFILYCSVSPQFRRTFCHLFTHYNGISSRSSFWNSNRCDSGMGLLMGSADTIAMT